jgi:hypothetical protein
MKPTKTSSTLVLIGLSLFVVLFVFSLYTFLHEAGHALTGLLFGQSLTEFSIDFWDMSAHVSMVGGELTQAQLAIQNVAGAALPLLIWTIFISLVPRKASFTLEILKLISSMAVINTLLAWIILPVLFLLGEAPPDDVTHFLYYSQIPPLFLICVALVLYIGLWVLFLSKIDGFRKEFSLFSSTAHERISAGIRPTLSAMTGILALCVIVVVILNIFAGRNSLNRFSPPQDFEPVAQIDLSTQTNFAETLTEFSLDKPSIVGVFVVLDDINTTYFDLSVTGPNGFHSIVLHGEGYNAFQDGGLWEKNLSAGTYRVVLTSHQSPGRASVYIKTH